MSKFITTASCNKSIKTLTLKEIEEWFEMLKLDYDVVVMKQETYGNMVLADPNIFKSFKVYIDEFIEDHVIVKINTSKLSGYFNSIKGDRDVS